MASAPPNDATVRRWCDEAQLSAADRKDLMERFQKGGTQAEHAIAVLKRKLAQNPMTK